MKKRIIDPTSILIRRGLQGLIGQSSRLALVAESALPQMKKENDQDIFESSSFEVCVLDESTGCGVQQALANNRLLKSQWTF